MSNFKPIYSNTGGKNLINTLQRNHIIAVLNAKSIVKQSLSITAAHTLTKNFSKKELSLKKKTKINNNGLLNINTFNRPKTPKVEYRAIMTNPLIKTTHSPSSRALQCNQVRALLRNLINIDKKSVANIKSLKKNMKIQVKREKSKKQKNFYVSDFIGRKEKGLVITHKKENNLDKLLNYGKDLSEKKMKIRSMSAKSIKKKNSSNFNSSQNLLALDQMIKNNTVQQPYNSNDKVEELYAALKILFDINELMNVKKKIVIYLVKNKIIEIEEFNRFKKELLAKFEQNNAEELRNILAGIENYIFK